MENNHKERDSLYISLPFSQTLLQMSLGYSSDWELCSKQSHLHNEWTIYLDYSSLLVHDKTHFVLYNDHVYQSSS